MADSGVGVDVKVAFGGALTLVLLAALVDDGSLAWLLTPIILGLFLYCIVRAPLRASLFTLMFFALTLENPQEAPAAGHWQSPLFKVGAAMLAHLNNLTGVSALFFSGMDLMLGLLILVVTARRMTGSNIDRAGRIPTPKPLVQLAYLSLAGIAYVWFGGLLRGGDFRMSLWQVEKVIYLPIVFLLFHVGLRGPKDHLALFKVILAAATVRALLAYYVYKTVVPPVDPSTGEAVLAYATSHHDSMLFASAFVLLLLLVFERAGRQYNRLALLLLPILTTGMIVNNRRMVWVQVILILLTLYLAMPDGALKRKGKRALLFSSPLAAVYIAVGWSSGTGIFKPVGMMRSVVEPSTDASSLWREMENYNLIFTLRQFPILGHGYGYGFWEVVHLPAVGYPLERFCPHNSILGLWAFCGYFGFTAITLLWGAGVYFGMRAYHRAELPTDRVAAIMSVGAVIIYMIQCYGDMGLGSWTGVYLVAPLLALAGKLAVATGTWGPSAAPDDPHAASRST